MAVDVLSLPLTSGVVPVVVCAAGALALIGLLVRRPARRWLPRAAIAAAAGAALGMLVSWLVGDVADVFGVPPSLGSRVWLSIALAAVAVAVLAVVTGRTWRRGAAGASIVLFALVGAIGINADIGEYPTVGALAGVGYGPLALPTLDKTADAAGSVSTDPLGSWRATGDLPQGGTVGSVTIPATVSGFHARSAIVYLPPAALVQHPPKLPVLVMMSGQPGSPLQLFQSGKLVVLLNAYAAAHHGVAPIVVSPDQLGAAEHNPMCVDSPLGNSATYVTVDVPKWIRSHLNVLDDRDDWAIGGFSQGGTCSIQFGAAHPDLFGGILDIAGELAPRSGTPANTIDSAFGGSAEAYQKAAPLSILAANAPYADTVGVFAAGSLDSRFGAGLRQVEQASAAAGIDSHLFISPGTAHDWYTVQYGVKNGLVLLGKKWGLS